MRVRINAALSLAGGITALLVWPSNAHQVFRKQTTLNGIETLGHSMEKRQTGSTLGGGRTDRVDTRILVEPSAACFRRS